MDNQEQNYAPQQTPPAAPPQGAYPPPPQGGYPPPPQGGYPPPPQGAYPPPPQGAYPPPQGYPGYPPVEIDAPNTGMTVLGAFIPIVGLILYLVWQQQFPMKARSAGKGAIIGVCIYVGLGILFGIMGACLVATSYSRFW